MKTITTTQYEVEIFNEDETLIAAGIATPNFPIEISEVNSDFETEDDDVYEAVVESIQDAVNENDLRDFELENGFIIKFS